jgi:hypothetical protein
MVTYPKYIIGTPISNNKVVVKGIHARTLLSVQISNQFNDSVLVIMMNPSKANKSQSDLTINKVLNLFNHSKIGTVKIANLFPVYKTKSALLYDTLLQLKRIDVTKYNQIISENLKILESEIKHSNFIVLAWGDTPNGMPTVFYEQMYNKILSSLHKNDKKALVFLTKRWENLLTLRRKPRHPNRNKLIGVVECKIDKFNRLTTGEEHVYIND